MAKVAIPPTPHNVDPHLKRQLDAIKENIETANGARRGKLDYLPDNASLADVITKVNDVIRALQD